MPPIPVGGAEAPRIGAERDEPLQLLHEGSGVMPAGRPAAIRESAPAKPSATAGWSESANKGKNKTKSARRHSGPKKLANANNTSGFTRRTGPLNSDGERSYAYRDPLLILFILCTPSVFAAFYVAFDYEGSRSGARETVTVRSSVSPESVAEPEAVSVNSQQTLEEYRLERDEAEQQRLERAEIARTTLPSCSRPPVSIVDQPPTVAVEGRDVAFGTTVTIRTGDPATIWTVRVCEPRNIMHDFETRRTALRAVLDVVQLPTIEPGMVVRLDDAPGNTTEAEMPATFVWGWDFSTSEADSLSAKQPWFCGYLTWDQDGPRVLDTHILTEGEMASGAVCTVVDEAFQLDTARSFMDFDDGTVSFAMDGVTQAGLLVDLAGS